MAADVGHDHLVEVVFFSFLHGKHLLSPHLPFQYYIVWEEVITHHPERVMLPSFRVKYLPNSFGKILHGRFVFSV